MQFLFWLAAIVALLTLGLFLLFEIAVARMGTVRPLMQREAGGERTKLSVVIPARNEEQDIEQALRSMLGQVGVDLQVIVINDHSTDKTGEIVRRVAKEDARITLIEDPKEMAGETECHASRRRRGH